MVIGNAFRKVSASRDTALRSDIHGTTKEPLTNQPPMRYLLDRSAYRAPREPNNSTAIVEHTAKETAVGSIFAILLDQGRGQAAQHAAAYCIST